MSNKPGFLARARAAFGVAKSLFPVGYGSYFGPGSWGNVIQEPFPGAWQQNQELKIGDSTKYFAVYSCITLIASDIGKLPFLVKRYEEGYWKTQRKSSWSWLNVAPNHYQTPSKFREQWIISKLSHGNTYALKQRDNRGNVVAAYILDPTRVQPLVSNETGEVFYRLSIDNLSGITEDLVVPASEIIHDRMNCLFHPLVGIPPLYAAAQSALTGITGQDNLVNFLRNASNPGGILVAPGQISQTSADNLKAYFNSNFSGTNAGRIAVVGDGLKFERLAMSSQDTQLIEHLKWTAEAICACFHVPAFMVIGGTQATNIEAAREQYYGQCLQSLINSMQECLDEGLSTGEDYGIELDLYELVRADRSTRITYLSNAVKGSIMTVNEARFFEDLPPVDGGDTVYMQQQNYSLSALAERDRNSPLLPAPPAPPAPVAPPVDDDPEDEPEEISEDEARSLLASFSRAFSEGETK